MCKKKTNAAGSENVSEGVHLNKQWSTMRRDKNVSQVENSWQELVVNWLRHPSDWFVKVSWEIGESYCQTIPLILLIQNIPPLCTLPLNWELNKFTILFRECWTNYRGPGFSRRRIIWLLPLPSLPVPVSVSFSRWMWSQIIRRRESWSSTNHSILYGTQALSSYPVG
jgi:hypothetical protein